MRDTLLVMVWTFLAFASFLVPALALVWLHDLLEARWTKPRRPGRYL
jgi:hypothetical protein